MKRMNELIKKIEEKDNFFYEFIESCDVNPHRFSFYEELNSVFSSLEENSWEKLKNKAIKSYLDHRSDIREEFKEVVIKQGFFNILNEAYAYKYLKEKRSINIEFLDERKNKKTPDLKFMHENKVYFCEVKTLAVSLTQLERQKNKEGYDCSIHGQLGDSFFDKMEKTIKTARKQIKGGAENHRGLIYLLINFDDITLDYFARYKEQIDRFLSQINTSREESFLVRRCFHLVLKVS